MNDQTGRPSDTPDSEVTNEVDEPGRQNPPTNPPQASGAPRPSPFSKKLIWVACVVGLVAIGGTAGIYLFGGLSSTDQGKLLLEVANTLLQVSGVVILAGILSYAVNSLTQRFQEQVATRQILHTSVEAARQRHHSNWQDKLTGDWDQRSREDELHRSLLEATIYNYNGVKRVCCTDG